MDFSEFVPCAFPLSIPCHCCVTEPSQAEHCWASMNVPRRRNLSVWISSRKSFSIYIYERQCCGLEKPNSALGWGVERRPLTVTPPETTESDPPPRHHQRQLERFGKVGMGQLLFGLNKHHFRIEVFTHNTVMQDSRLVVVVVTAAIFARTLCSFLWPDLWPHRYFDLALVTFIRFI